MGKLKVTVSNRQNKVKIPSGMRLLLRRSCHAVLNDEGFSDDAELSITFMDNADIRDLNREYRQKNSATDVLSFPLGENGVYDKNEETGAMLLGDIVISVEKAVEQAQMYGHDLNREMAFLCVHSVLHLLGYDHELSPVESSRMREKEERTLQRLGLSRETVYSQLEDDN